MPAKTKPNIETAPTAFLPTETLLTKFHPENPNVHDDERDIKSIIKSLLEFGWATSCTLNIRTDKLVGGHGRVTAANKLRSWDEKQFEREWKAFQKRAEGADIDSASERFKADYWEQCLVTFVDVAEEQELALMVRLNNRDADGRIDPKLQARVLAKIPDYLAEQAGWKKSDMKTFVSSFLQKVPEPVSVSGSLGDTDFAAKQVFERPDATDYSVRDAEGFPDASPVTSFRANAEDFQMFTPPVEPEVFTTASGESVVIAEPTTEIVADFRHPDVAYDSGVEGKGTRAVLLFSKTELEEYKALVKVSLGRLLAMGVQIDISKGADYWKPDVVCNVLKWFLEQTQEYAINEEVADGNSESITPEEVS